jgi:hypothetical protein
VSVRLGLLALVLVAGVASAREIETETSKITYGGSLRTINAGLRVPASASASRAAGVSQNILRLTFESSHFERVKFQFHGVQEWTFSSTPGFGLR